MRSHGPCIWPVVAPYFPHLALQRGGQRPQGGTEVWMLWQLILIVSLMAFTFSVEKNFWAVSDGFLDWNNQGGKTKPECGQCHPMTWGPGLNFKKWAEPQHPSFSASWLWLWCNQPPHVPAVMPSQPWWTVSLQTMSQEKEKQHNTRFPYVAFARHSVITIK